MDDDVNDVLWDDECQQIAMDAVDAICSYAGERDRVGFYGSIRGAMMTAIEIGVERGREQARREIAAYCEAQIEELDRQDREHGRGEDFSGYVDDLRNHQRIAYQDVWEEVEPAKVEPL